MQPGSFVKDSLLISCPLIQNWDQCIVCGRDWEQMEVSNCKKLIHCQWNVPFYWSSSCSISLVCTISSVAFATGAHFPTNAALSKYYNSEKTFSGECHTNPTQGIRNPENQWQEVACTERRASEGNPKVSQGISWMVSLEEKNAGEKQQLALSWGAA